MTDCSGHGEQKEGSRAEDRREGGEGEGGAQGRRRGPYPPSLQKALLSTPLSFFVLHIFLMLPRKTSATYMNKISLFWLFSKKTSLSKPKDVEKYLKSKY